jgi:hypothetical protein
MSKRESLDYQYKPQNQKSLFNQKCVSDIKKFIKELANTPEESQGDITYKNFKKILFLNGPSGCGKQTTINILFKNYNVISIDSDSVRLSDNISNIINSLASFNAMDLSQFEKKKSKAHLGNILLIKNAQHCEKTLNGFIDDLYIKSKRNIPIIIHCDKQQYRQRFKCEYPITYVDFSLPSHTELTQLLNTINKDHKLKLSDESISKAIETSLYDINQFFYIVEYIKINKYNEINTFDNLKKDHDIDLHDKLESIFDLENEYNFTELDNLTYSDSSVISNCIFQNYPQIFTYHTPYKGVNDKVMIDHLHALADISDTLCYNYTEDETCINDLNNSLSWNNHNILNCVLPMYKIHEAKNDHENYINHNLKNSFSNFKNYSYNYINSYKELTTLTLNSSNNINGSSIKKTFTHGNMEEICIVFNTIISFIQNMNTMLDKGCKKRNASNDELLTIIKSDDIIYKQFQHINDVIWNYTLFETNENINKIKYKESEITIDIKIFKRYINIFSFLNVSKLLKISTENLIKNEIKNRIILMQNNLFIQNTEDTIDQLTYDLGDIWSCMKTK